MKMICEYSLKRYCNGDFTKIENYEKAIADNTMWACHHRLETHFSDGTLRPVDARLTKAELKALDMYFNRPPEELIFLSQIEHCRLHLIGTKRPHTEKYKEKMRENASHAPRTEEVKRKISETAKGMNVWTKGRKWYHNDTTEILGYECPEGFVRGRLCPEKLFGKPSSNRD